jgi:hypothetical protein
VCIAEKPNLWMRYIVHPAVEDFPDKSHKANINLCILQYFRP